MLLPCMLDVILMEASVGFKSTLGMQEVELLRQQLAEAVEVQEAQAGQLRELERSLADAGKAWAAADKAAADLRQQSTHDKTALNQQVALLSTGQHTPTKISWVAGAGTGQHAYTTMVCVQPTLCWHVQSCGVE